MKFIKHFSTVLFISSFLCSIISCDFFCHQNKIQCNNLFLVYMAGDNSLNRTVYSDIEEMKNGMHKENDIVLVLADRYSPDYFEDEWNEARLFQIAYEEDTVAVQELEDKNIGITLEWLDDVIDSGREETLCSFLQYAQNHYEYKNVYLDLWNHGGGWTSGDSYKKQNNSARNICNDEESHNSLSPKEVSNAIRQSHIKHFNIILMDACYMASIEVSAELLGLTDTIIFSQDSIPEDGMPYNQIIPILFSDESNDEKCRKMCNSYINSYKKKKTSISAVRIDEDNQLQIFLNDFENYISNITDLRNIINCREYNSGFLNEVIDFGILFDDFLKSKYSNILIYNSSDLNSGMSIYFPEFISYSKDSWEYTAERLNFLSICPSYLKFLSKVEKEKSSPNQIDFLEPNNYLIDSYKINISEKNIQSYLWCPCDEDWYEFSFSTKPSRIELYEPEFFDYNLIVFLYKDGILIQSLYEDDKSNVIELSDYDYDSFYVKIYSSFGYYNQTDPYILEWS